MFQLLVQRCFLLFLWVAEGGGWTISRMESWDREGQDALEVIDRR